MVTADPTVDVLLATYNGERFLREQIDSILAQTYAPLRVVARDDGSSDGTPAILAEYAARFPERFRVVTGAPTGNAKYNFAKLMEESTAEYMSFADQDDVWVPEKVATGMAAMRRLEARHGEAMPLLTFSDLRVVDAELETMYPSYWAHQPIVPEMIHTLRRTLMQNTVTGCTAIVNRPLAELAMVMPREVHMHDWWIAVLASAFGAAEPIAEKLVLYRQHGGNVIGASVKGRSRLIPKWRNHRKRLEGWEMAVNMARCLLRVHGERLTPEKRATAETFVRIDESRSAVERVRLFLSLRLYLAGGMRSTLAMLWVVADLGAARRDEPVQGGI